MKREESRYEGMTVNERLCLSGLLYYFGRAVEDKDKNRVIAILKEVEIDDKERTQSTPRTRRDA